MKNRNHKINEAGSYSQERGEGEQRTKKREREREDFFLINVMI